MRKALFLMVIALLAWPGAAALAQGHARDRVRAGDALPLDSILPQIRRDHPGSFYDAEGPFPDSQGGYYYRLKWLTPGGRVIWLNTDARTGRVRDGNQFRDRGGDEEHPHDYFNNRQDESERPHNGFRDDNGNDQGHDGRRGRLYHERNGDWPGFGQDRNNSGRGNWGGGGGRHRGHGGF